MTAFKLFMVMAIGCALVNVVFSMMIVHWLRSRGIKINWCLLRLYLPKYAYQYKKLTMAETGMAGPLFGGWVYSINAAWIFALVGLILKYIKG